MEPPVKPDESDCCNSGCNPCILDVYEEQLKIYEQKKNIPKKPSVNCMSPSSYTIFKLVNIEKQSEEAFLYTFEYSHPLRGKRDVINLGLHYEPGQHFLMKARYRGEEFTRAYTPIPMEDHEPFRFTTLIKLYKRGKMSNYLKTIQTGSKTLWRGPYGEFRANYGYKFLFLLAQGTGIAPIYSVICDMTANEGCYTFLKLFYCCKDSNNIYLRDQIYKLSSIWNFTYEIFLSRSEDAYEKYNETIHKKKLEFAEIQTYLSDKHEDVNVLICGSDSFTESLKKQILDCRVREQNVYIF